MRSVQGAGAGREEAEWGALTEWSDTRSRKPEPQEKLRGQLQVS